jgi:hypothetical protein
MQLRNKSMKIRILSLLFAAVLHVVPLARVVYTTAQTIVPEGTVIFRLVIGAVAALGAFDAVSGASTIITSPNNATGTVGQAFSYRITVGPRSASVFRAAPLPDGLHMDRSYIRGTPTTVGETRVRLTASDGGHSVSKMITIYILAPPGASPPTFIEQPRDQNALPGEATTFHASVASEASARFQWLFNGAPITDGTNSDLTFVNTPNVFVGQYSVIAVNAFGSVTSSPARLYLRIPLVDANAAWSYSDTGRPQPGAWRKLPFKDAAWLVGTGPFGYGWGDEITFVSTGPNPLRTNITTYFRHKFVVADSNAYSGFNVAFQADDGAVVFLNGKELSRLNLKPRGAVSPRSLALSARDHPADQQWFTTNFFRPLVLTGTNIFAIEVHQAKTNGADMRFDFRFSGLRTEP